MENSDARLTPPQIPKPKLTLSTKLAYGAGDLGAGLTSNLLAFSYLIFLTNVAGLNPLLASTVLAVGRLWDGVNDPLVGMLSDRTRTRWGRRYPWIALTGIPFGLTFFLNWIVPGFLNTSMAKFWYYVVISSVFQVFFTTTNLPYTVLTAEMTQDYDERTELTSFRLSFSLTGAVLILAIGLGVSSVIANEATQYAVMGALGSVAAIASRWWF